MPPVPDAPLTKVTVNLYTADVDKMRARWGPGWSVRLRKEVQAMLNDARPKARVEDLENE